MYPPVPAKLREVYELGYRDALSWLAKNGRIPYGTRLDSCVRACMHARSPPP